MPPRATGGGERLELRLLGEPTLRVGGRELRSVNRKLVCALALLALSEGRRLSRDQVASLLWSESAQPHARGSLRQLITALRREFRAVGYAGFEATRNQLSLDPALLSADVHALLDRAAMGETHPDLLTQHDLPDALMRGWDNVDPAFADWLQAERDRLRERLRRSLSRLWESQGIDSRPGREAARALVRLDPTQERAAQALMASLARGGDGTAALAVYGELSRMLGQHHDAAPSRKTLELARRIRAGELEPAPAPAPEDAPEDAQGVGDAAGRGAPAPAGAFRPTPDAVLLVEPFTMRGGRAEERAALDGLREALIGSLIRFREWQVAEAPEGDAAGTRTATRTGPQDGLRFGLRGSARHAPGGIEISLTLRELATGRFLWSETLDLPADDGAEARPRDAAAADAATGRTREAAQERRERLLRQMAIALNVRLSEARPGGSGDGSRRETWLRGQRMILNFDPESWLRVGREMRALVDAAPDYAPAWSALAQIENTAHIARPGMMREGARAAAAAECALRAVALDPLDSRARLALGWAHVYSGRWRAAADAFDMALQLNPHDAWILTSVAQAMAAFGHHARAARLAGAALEAMPLTNQSRWGYHASIRFFGGDFEGALEAGRLAGDSHANSGGWRAGALAHLGRREEARAEARQLVARLARVWVADTVPDPLACSRWVLGVVPTRREAEWRLLRDGLAMAGLPAAGLDWPGLAGGEGARPPAAGRVRGRAPGEARRITGDSP